MLSDQRTKNDQYGMPASQRQRRGYVATFGILTVALILWSEWAFVYVSIVSVKLNLGISSVADVDGLYAYVYKRELIKGREKALELLRRRAAVDGSVIPALESILNREEAGEYGWFNAARTLGEIGGERVLTTLSAKNRTENLC